MGEDPQAGDATTHTKHEELEFTRCKLVDNKIKSVKFQGMKGNPDKQKVEEKQLKQVIERKAKVDGST